jgi:hemerythrin-like domain-containing protein
MRLIDELRAEHDLIERVAGSLLTYVARRGRGEGDPADGPRFLQFFRHYAGHFHHAREEDTLFVSLERDAELPADRGPIKVLLDDHARMARLLGAMEPLLGSPLEAEADRRRLEALATDYVHALWHHIDAENSVLLPESAKRLRQHGVNELPSREMTPEERESMVSGEALLGRYPPTDDPSVFRGDGCVMCPAFVDSCRGLEHEWWNDWEWDEFEQHLSGE